MKTATLFSPADFECVGEGNPLPTYQWLQTLPTPSGVVLERGRDAKLHISNVTYDYQGEYRCKVTNVINGQERSELSHPIILQVVGKLKTLSVFFSFHLIILRMEFSQPINPSLNLNQFQPTLIHRKTPAAWINTEFRFKTSSGPIPCYFEITLLAHVFYNYSF